MELQKNVQVSLPNILVEQMDSGMRNASESGRTKNTDAKGSAKRHRSTSIYIWSLQFGGVPGRFLGGAAAGDFRLDISETIRKRR